VKAGKGTNGDSKMVSNSIDRKNERWIKAGSLIIDYPAWGKVSKIQRDAVERSGIIFSIVRVL
jgi:hypothetical protein